jgi:hypothetical protein
MIPLFQTFAAFAGILTGFCFTAFVSYLTGTSNASETSPQNDGSWRHEAFPSRSRIGRGDVAVTLFLTAISLGMCTFLYVNFVSHAEDKELASTALLLYGVAFGLSVMTFFYTLTLMMFERSIPQPATEYAYWVVVVAGPAMIFRFLASTANNTLHIRCPTCSAPLLSQLGIEFMLFFIVGISILITLSGLMRRASGLIGIRIFLGRSPTAPGAIVFLFVFSTVTVVSLYLTTRNEHYTPPQWFTYGSLGVGSLILILFALTCGCVVGSRVDFKLRWDRWIELADYIETRINAGKPPANEIVPNEQEIAKEYQVKVMTARRAIRRLKNLGLIQNVDGRETYIASRESSGEGASPKTAAPAG